MVMATDMHGLRGGDAAADTDLCGMLCNLLGHVLGALGAGTAWLKQELSWSTMSMGAAFLACVAALVGEQAVQTRPWSRDIAQMNHAVSLLSTIVLMAAWMFVNWCGSFVLGRFPSC